MNSLCKYKTPNWDSEILFFSWSFQNDYFVPKSFLSLWDFPAHSAAIFVPLTRWDQAVC